MARDPKPDWKLFELAVARFIKTVGGNARVTHDKRLPDVHTGQPRQRDVWIEWKIAEHYPAKALVSCKYWGEVLDQQDIDHFNGEFLSSGAQIGIIYSRFGYNENAIAKAKHLGFHCCRLFQNEPAELPETLLIAKAFHFRPIFHLSCTGPADTYKFTTLNDLLNQKTKTGTVFSDLVKNLADYQSNEVEGERWTRAQRGRVFKTTTAHEHLPPLVVTLKVKDRAFRAKLEFTLLNGSYNATSNEFLGEQTTPSIDLWSSEPGDGWEEITSVPDMPKTVFASFAHYTPEEALREYGKLPFPEQPSSRVS